MNGRANLPHIEETEVVLEELFRHTPVGVVLSDLHGTIWDVNDSLCAMVGYQRADLIGHKLTEFTHPDDMQDVLSRTADLREGRTGQYVVNRRYIARDGKVVHAKVSVSVIYSRTHEPVCGIGFLEDITERVAMETELRQSELRYRRVIEDQTDMIVRCLPDGTRTFVNQAYCRYNGTTADQLIGTSFFPLIPEQDRERVREKYASFRPENPVLTEQHWAIAPGGELRWHEWIDRAFFDENGTLVEIQAVGRDLTEQHEAQQRLVESEVRYRRLFNSLPIAVWEADWSELVKELDRRGFSAPEKLIVAIRDRRELFYELAALVRIRNANSAALKMAGVATVEEFGAWLSRAATPDSALRYTRVVPGVIFGETKLSTEQLTLIRADGTPIEVLFRVARSERWGQDWMVYPIAIDISEQKRIEAELVHKQELTERAEAAAHLGSWEWNPSEDMIYGSAEFWRILDGRDGGGPTERPMRECLALMHPDDGASAAATWLSLRAQSSGEKPAMIENDYRLARPDGSIATARGQTFLSYAPDGSLSRAFGIMRDITAAKRAEEESARHREELLRADKMISLGILVSGMAHEINNPNHSIGLNVPLVRQAWRDAAALLDEVAEVQPDLRVGRLPWKEARSEVASMLDDIDHASERIRNIVTELRGFALDHDPGERHNVSVNEIVQSSLRLLGKHIARATKHFHIELAREVPAIAGNPSRLEQVVVNLVINACQALQSADQSIRILTGADGQRVFIRVRDEGRGIAAEHLANIRTPFFTTKRAEGGTGLGLAVSDRIAGEHGGELTFESEFGCGTTATLWLPIART